jgi:phospholipid/cholesterol/gamma-HCH transport system permease protein
MVARGVRQAFAATLPRPRVVTTPAGRPTPPPPPAFSRPLRSLEAAGGRFIGRSRLAAGALYWLFWRALSRRAAVSSGVMREVETLGLGALRLVVGASVLVGLIATFQVAYQLKAYGAQSLSANTIGWFTAREIGPLVAALIIVARSASAIAGEFASMSANGEIDALRAMGLDPVKYLVAPKLAALLIVLPAMTIFAICFIAVGVWVGNLLLGYTPNYVLTDIRNSLDMRDVLIGVGKSLIFGLVLGVIAADEGLSIERRVSAIGAAATRSVMFCMLAILAVDTFVNAIFYFIPGLV